MAPENENEEVVVEVKFNINCLVEDMIKRRFSTLPLTEKKIIVNSPKPAPNLDIQSKTKTFRRHFNREIYEKVEWICGCAHLSKLFCWPCILFSPEINVWNKYGFCDLNNLSKARKRHECSQYHICAAVQFKRFGKETRADIFSTQYKENIEMHNKEVTANRYILSKLISAVCFLIKQEQPLGGIDENEINEDGGNLVELLYLLSESDIKLKTHLENSEVFSEMSSHIQSNLVCAMSRVLQNEIRCEISSTKFVSVIVDDYTDISSRAQLSTIIRYMDENSQIQERFVGFVDAGPDRTAEALYHHIHNILEEYGCLEKLVSVAYDGAAVISEEHNEVQQRIREVCPYSLFVHCHAHRLDDVLSQSLQHIPGCKRFFSRVLSFSSFFNKSTRRTSLLDYEVKKKFPTASQTRWTHLNKVLSYIFRYQEELTAIFNQIMSEEDEWDADAVVNAEVLHRYLRDFEFNFNLNLFTDVFTTAESLYEVLQDKPLDVSCCLNEVKKFVKFLEKKEGDFELLWDKVMTGKFNRKRNNSECLEDAKKAFKVHQYRVLESLSTSMSDRFRDAEKLKFMELFNVRKFKDYGKSFPDALFKAVEVAYGKYFEFAKLKSELVYMFLTPEFHVKSINCIKELIVRDELKEVLTEVFDLIQLICTIPSTSVWVTGGSFSTMERIKKFAESRQVEEDRLSDLAFISIEKRLMLNLKNYDKFYDAVIDEFSKTEEVIKLNFKQ